MWERTAPCFKGSLRKTGCETDGTFCGVIVPQRDAAFSRADTAPPAHLHLVNHELILMGPCCETGLGPTAIEES